MPAIQLAMLGHRISVTYLACRAKEAIMGGELGCVPIKSIRMHAHL